MNYFERIKGAPLNIGKRKSSPRRMVRDVLPPNGRASLQQGGPPIPSPRAKPPVQPPPPPYPPKPQRRPSRPQPRPFPSVEPPPAIEPDGELTIRAWEPETARRSRIRRRLIVASLVILVIIGFGAPTFIFPTFSITIHPKIESMDLDRIEISAEPALTAPEASGRKIPAIAINVEQTIKQEYEASGKKFVQERARGTVNIFNAFSSQPQVLVASTRLQDPSGKVFRLVERIIIPGAGVEEGKIVPTSIAAEVIAEGSGDSYNIGPAEFRIPGFRGTPKYQGFYARSEKAFAGGFEGEARIVLSEDIKRASEDLTRRVFELISQELDAKSPAGPDFLSPPGSREIAVVKIDTAKVGERFELFPATVSARGRVLAVRRSQLHEVLAAILLPSASELALQTAPTQKELVLEGAKLEGGGSRLILALKGKLDYFRDINVEELKSILLTSTPKKAEAYLRGREEIGSFRIKRFPSWLWFIPLREDGLRVMVEPPA